MWENKYRNNNKEQRWVKPLSWEEEEAWPMNRRNVLRKKDPEAQKKKEKVDNMMTWKRQDEERQTQKESRELKKPKKKGHH